MQPPSPDPTGASSRAPDDTAANLFVSYLAQRGSPDEVSFEDFCDANFESAGELRRLQVEWTQADGVLRRLGMSKSVRGAAAAASRAHSAVARVDTAILAEVLERLSGRQRAFDRYGIEEEIARGGMGSIQRVWDQDLRRHLAMKVVLQRGTADRPDKPGQTRALGRFIEEAQVTGQLDHPGIVPVHELGIDDEGRAFFTMQLVRGRDLEALFEIVHGGKDEEWTQTRALNVLLRVCDAMAYAHAKGVIHRDLKPANVMSGRFGEVYVMDWGLARVLGEEDPHDLRLERAPDPNLSLSIHTDRKDVRDAENDSPLVTLDGDVVGTPAYMSPEQARGDLEAMGPTSDVYSLGAMLYHLLAGHMPYQGPGQPVNALATWGLVQAGPPAALHEEAPTAPAELIAICEKAMAREPVDRYQDMGALGRDLRAFLEGRVVRAYETGAVAEFKKWVVRNRALSTTGFAAGLLIVAGLSSASVVLARKNDQLTESNRRAHDSELLAIDREQQATANARIAEERAETILRLADSKRLEQLHETAALLWPAFPNMVEAYREWLRGADELLGRLGNHRSELTRLRGEALTAQPYLFANAELQWQHDALVDLIGGLERLDTPGALRDQVRARLERAETIAAASITGPESAARWERAIANLASTSSSPVYGGLEIAPQLGLLPLGKDPRSDLWEFVDLQTGVEPERDPITRELLLTEDTGLVFVLIPGGEASIGSQSNDTTGPNYLPRAPANEGPNHPVSLAPFFLSKYEMTQGQWSRFTGENPSFYLPGEVFLGHLHDLLHPVEQVSWTDCKVILGRLGMSLPTEAQWEYAARGGTTTPWSTGEERESLEGYANLADDAAARLAAPWPDVGDWPELDDGWGSSSRVGSFEPNPFGLHDVHGNLWEWCADAYEEGYLTLERPGDGLREVEKFEAGVNRGGSFKHTSDKARSGYRNRSSADLIADVMGVRPARSVQN